MKPGLIAMVVGVALALLFLLLWHWALFSQKWAAGQGSGAEVQITRSRD